MLEYAIGVMTSLLFYGLVALATLWCGFQWKYRKLLNNAAKLPVTFPVWPILGHAYFMFWGLEQGTAYILEFSRRAVVSGYKIICFWCGPLPYFVVHDPEYIQQILTSSNTFEKGDEYQFFKDGLDSGIGPIRDSLVTAPGSHWKITRRHMNTLFFPRNLELLIPVFNKNSRELVDSLAESIPQGPVDIMDHTMDVGLKTICNLVFGLDVEIDAKCKEFQGLKSVVEKIPEVFVKRVTQPWLRIEPLFHYLFKHELEEIDTNWRNFTEAPLKMTKDNNTRKMEMLNKDKGVIGGSKHSEGLLNILDVFNIIKKKYPQFTEVDMRSEMLTLYETGTDTVASTTAYCLLALAQYQDIQDRVYEEIITVVGPNDDVTLENLNKLTYLEQVVKETLRWFTLVPYVFRKTAEDMKFDECTIPAGNTVIVCLAATHMNPKLYPEPHEFDPDRFSPEKAAGRDRFNFVAFSGGPRDCIGKTYALYLMKVILVHVLRNYKAKAVLDIHKLRRRLVVALASADGYCVNLEPRS